MKTRAGILAFIVGLLIIQPLFARFGLKEAYGACATVTKLVPVKKQCPSAKKQCAPVKKQCIKTKSGSKPASSEKSTDCKKENCNPLLGCSQGNFYIHHYSTIAINSLMIPKLKMVVFNDNRILNRLSECWQPPEMI